MLNPGRKMKSLKSVNPAPPVPDNFISEIKSIVESGRKQAYSAVNQAMITTYWTIGKRIVHE